MTERENFLAMVNGEQPEFVPTYVSFQNMCIGVTVALDGALKSGKDGFGVNWVENSTGAIPEPNNFRFDDIADWKEYVTFPDVDAVPFEQIYRQEEKTIDRENKMVVFHQCVGPFERMVSFMGFENTLISMAEDPESCAEFISAFTDYQLKVLEKAIPLYKPDMVMEYDDVATARSLFMSPDTWRKLFKPSMKRIGDFLKDRNIYFGYHVCGKVEDIIPDLVEVGVRYWNSAQIMNDLKGIMEKYGNRLIVDGGWDTSGPPSYIGASKEAVLAEAERCLKEYGHYNNFVLFPVLLNERGNAFFSQDDRLDAMLAYWNQNHFHSIADKM